MFVIVNIAKIKGANIAVIVQLYMNSLTTRSLGKEAKHL